MLALCRAGTLQIDEIVRVFAEIAPRIESEALPRITENDFRRKVEAFAARARLPGA